MRSGGQQTRGRRLAAMTAGVLVVLLLALFPAAAGSSGAGAGAYLASLGAQATGAVEVPAAAGDNTVTASDAAASSALQFSSGQAEAASFVDGNRLISRARASLTGVNLLSGVVTADSVSVAAQASAGSAGGQAAIDGSAVSGLVVNGQAVASDAGVIDVPDVGTLSVLASTRDSGGSTASAQVVGLRLVLSAAVGDLPAGTVIVVGHARAMADEATLADLTNTPTPKPKPTPSARPSTPRSTPTPTPTVVVSPTSSTPTAAASGYQPLPSGSRATVPPTLEFPGAVFPVLGRYAYINDWRFPRVGHLHEGNDIFAAYGTPVVAVQDGTISMISTYGLGGNALHLTNAGGDYFYYAHLSAFAAGLYNGLAVRAGQVIGYVGTTGNAQGTLPHLHFEIHPQGGPAIDPFPYLELWRTGQEAAAAASGQTTDVGFDPSLLAAMSKDKKGGANGEPGALGQIEAAAGQAQPGLAGDAGQADGGASPAGESLPLVIISAIGAAVLKRLQLSGLGL